MADQDSTRGARSPSGPIRILHVAESAKGGVGTYLAELLPELARIHGTDNVRAVVPESDARHIAGVDRHIVNRYRRHGRSIVSLVMLMLALRHQVARFRPTVIHAHSSFAGLVVRLLYGWRSHRPRIVYCAHGWGFDRSGRSLSNWLAIRTERFLARWCDSIVVISSYEGERAREAGIAPDRLQLVLNGIADTPPTPPTPWDDARLKVLFIGRLDRQKGADVLLDAIEPLADRVAVRIVGRAVADSAFRRRRVRHVAYVGWRSLAEVSAEIAAADIVVVPSRWEGFGLVALEAMRAGKAVLASAVGGLPEVVEDGVTGRLVPPNNPYALMHALANTSRMQWQLMGQRGRERFLAHFTADRMAMALSQLYADLIGEAPGLMSSRPPPIQAEPRLETRRA